MQLNTNDLAQKHATQNNPKSANVSGKREILPNKNKLFYEGALVTLRSSFVVRKKGAPRSATKIVRVAGTNRGGEEEGGEREEGGGAG